LHRPLRRIERGKKNRCRLNREPRHDGVGDRDLIHVAPFQLGKEVMQVQSELLARSGLIVGVE